MHVLLHVCVPMNMHTYMHATHTNKAENIYVCVCTHFSLLLFTDMWSLSSYLAVGMTDTFCFSCCLPSHWFLKSFLTHFHLRIADNPVAGDPAAALPAWPVVGAAPGPGHCLQPVVSGCWAGQEAGGERAAGDPDRGGKAGARWEEGDCGSDSPGMSHQVHGLWLHQAGVIEGVHRVLGLVGPEL